MRGARGRAMLRAVRTAGVRAAVGVGLTVIGTTASSIANVDGLTPPLDACVSTESAPRSQEHLLCLYRVAVRHGKLPDLRDHLVRLGAGATEQPWPTLVLGYATQQEDEVRAARLYETAATGFARTSDAEGEVLARHNLRNIYYRRGATDTAADQVARALAAAESSGEPMTSARAAVLEATHVIQAGGDMGRAYRTLQRARRLAFPDGPIGLRRAILLPLANAALFLGAFDEAIEALEQHRFLAREDGSSVDAATVAFNLLNATLTQQEQRPRRGARAQLVEQATAVLAEVQRLERPALVARTHRVLADLTRAIDPARAAAHLRRCLEIETPLGHPELRAGCLWTLSLLEARQDAPAAERASREALDVLAAMPESPLLVFAWQARLRLAWETMGEDAAMTTSLQALDAIERLRSRQQDGSSRAALFSHWTRDYYWLTGRLLQADTPRLSQAFEVGERLRTRVLLEHLERAGVARAPGRLGREPHASRDRLRRRIVETQRQLLLGGGGDPAQRSLLEQLQILESEEGELEVEGTFDSPHSPTFATLADVRMVLDDSEALLWYSIAPWEDVYGDFGGGAWVVTITREHVRLHRLAGSPDLHSQAAALVGLLRDRELPAARWAPAAARLGRVLLAPALAELPQRVRRLVIVSDGDLHALPFEVLTPAAGVPPVGERFEVTVVPSATLWLHLRRRDVSAPGRTTLVLADPTLAAGAAATGIRFAPLPWARREARAIARRLRLSRDRVHEGEAASESFLKSAAMADVAILHLAAHARADSRFPDRSAVFLAAGDATEDGWLQPKEIAALDLRGRLVVLSACESAGGPALSGEGPLSLARAFFAAGANAVLATRWPLRDDDAAIVMAEFYHALARGENAASALRSARREAIGQGLPAAAWAGLVLIGDGRRAPIVAVTSDPFDSADAIFAVALVTAAGVAAMITMRRRRRTRRSDAA